MRKAGNFLSLVFSAFLLSACALSKPPAYDLPSAEGIYRGMEVTVGPSETLYAVAMRNKVRLRELIVINDLKPPYAVRQGQKLYLPARDPYVAPTPRSAPLAAIDKSGAAVTADGAITSVPLEAPPQASKTNLVMSVKPRAATDVPELDLTGIKAGLKEELKKEEPAAVLSAPPAPQPEVSGDFPTFSWPVRGTIISPFGPSGKGRDNDGINIAAPKGSPVKAAGAGSVAYAGNEMKGFGNLVLIRHPGGWVTAYAHLDRIVVSRDASVSAGDTIGTIGSSGGVGSPQLHFEARRDGKPVDPELVLR